MYFFKTYLLLTVFFAASLSAAAQDVAGTRIRTLFEGNTIREVQLSGDLDVEIRQGTPNGVVLEIPQNIPVDTVYNPLYGDLKWMIRTLNRKEVFEDTVRCTFVGGMLRLENTRLRIDRLSGGGFRTNWIAGPKIKAVITVGDLRTLRAFTKGTVRFSGKIHTTETALWIQSADGLELTAQKRVSINTLEEGIQNIRISDTPQVNIRMHTRGTLDLSVDGVGYLSVVDHAGGTAKLSGTVDSLHIRSFNNGIIDATSLKAAQIVPTKELDRTDISLDEDWIIEKKGKTVNIRQKK